MYFQQSSVSFLKFLCAQCWNLKQSINNNLMIIKQSSFEQKSLGSQPPLNLSNLLKQLQPASNVSPSQKQYLRLCRIHSLLYAIFKAKAAISDAGITKNIICYPACREARKHIDELDGSEVKHHILANLQNDISQLKIASKKLKSSVLGQEGIVRVGKLLSTEEIGELINVYLSKIPHKLKISLKNGSVKKNIYGLINFKWTDQFVKSFIFNLDQKIQHMRAIENQLEILGSKQIYVKRLQHNRCSENLQFEKMQTEQLFKYIQNKKIGELLQRRFELLSDRLNNKELLCKVLQNKLDYFQQVMRNQIRTLSKQFGQKQMLKQKFHNSEKELKILNLKSKLLEQELQKIDEKMQNLKENSMINQRKYDSIISKVQRSSDCLLEKDHVKNLVKIVLQQIKLSHQIFYNMKASRFMVYRFDCEIAKLLKAAPAFDKVNLQQHLEFKQMGFGSEVSTQISMISSFSEDDSAIKMTA